ncbi:MAG: hypothetical protein ABIE14_04230 [Patescibacteria group bacterium]
MDYSQVAAQKRDGFLAKVEASPLSPKIKERFRRECNLLLQDNNPFEKFHDLEEELNRYQDFVLGMKTDFLYERDGFLLGEMDGLPLWGGKTVSYGAENLPSEAVDEKLFWLYEFIEPHYDNQHNPQKIDASKLEITKQKMQTRMKQIRIEAAKRKKQIYKFQTVRGEYPSLVGRFKKLFSLKHFQESTFEARRNILLRIARQIGKIDATSDFPKLQDASFDAEMKIKMTEAEKLPPSQAWEIYKAEEQKLRNPPKQLKGLEIFAKWKSTFGEKRKKCEAKIGKKLEEIRATLSEKGSTGVLQKDWEYVSTLSPQFKLEATLGFPVIDLELQLWEKIHNPGGKQDELIDFSDEASFNYQIRENLLEAQKENEFIRRMFIQIAALGMAFGKDTSTLSKTQQQLVKADMVSKENLKASEEKKITQAAAQQTSRDLVGAKTAESVDTISAIQDEKAIQFQKSGSGLEAEVSAEAQTENKVDSWEMTRLIGIKAWPPQQLEDYLRGVKHSEHHLEITHDYQPVSFIYAATLLKQRIAANLNELPGKTAQRKKTCQRVFFNYVDSAEKADDSFAEKIFSYTPNV